MTTATPGTGTRVSPPAEASSRFAKLPVLVTGAVAAAAGAAVLYAYGALAQALSVPMRAGEIGASHADAITPASHTATTTRLTLALGHLIAAAIVIPILTRRLAHAPGRAGGQVRRG